jgi:hypothetical protein
MGEGLALKVVDQPAPSKQVPRSLDERITLALSSAASPLPFAGLRSQCRVRAATLYERLGRAHDREPHVRCDEGYRLARERDKRAKETRVCTENLIRIDCVTESPKRQRR